ncbi:MAG: hypothetical protein ACLVBD_10290, partial [Hominilimicola sp.]
IACFCADKTLAADGVLLIAAGETHRRQPICPLQERKQSQTVGIFVGSADKSTFEFYFRQSNKG